MFDDGTYTECPDGEFIDSGEQHTLECARPGGNKTMPVVVRHK